TPSNVVVNIIPSPNRIPRDGVAKSNITAFVGRLDEITGQISPLPNVEVRFGFMGGDNGTLDPLVDDPQDPESKGRKTSEDGIATTVYTTDAGDESDEVLIVGTVIVDGIPVANSGLIIKEVDTGHTFSLVGKPDSLSATGGTSALTATVVDREGNPVANGTPVEFVLTGVGTTTPSKTTVTGGQGVATSTYSVGPQDQPQFPLIVAKATIAGIGVVYSNDLYIPIGVDTSKYRVNITASPTTVEAGS